MGLYGFDGYVETGNAIRGWSDGLVKIRLNDNCKYYRIPRASGASGLVRGIGKRRTPMAVSTTLIGIAVRLVEAEELQLVEADSGSP